MEAPDVDRVGELDDVAGPVHIRAAQRVLVGLHVVDRGEVEEVVDLLVEALDAKPRLGEVTGHGNDAITCIRPLRELVEPASGALANERVDRAVALQKLGEKMPADEARRAGDEVVQTIPLLIKGHNCTRTAH